VLLTNSHAAESKNIEAFRHGLQALGYVEGQTITLEYRLADGNLEQLTPFAAKLVRLNVAVIVTSGSLPTPAAQHATTTIPIVMTIAGGPSERSPSSEKGLVTGKSTSPWASLVR
jgi:putative ABC transport system substrate-binding protein